MARTGTRSGKRKLALRFGAMALAGTAGLGLLAACSSSSSSSSGSSSSTQCAGRPSGFRPSGGHFTGTRPTAFPSGLRSRPAGAPTGGFGGCGGFGGGGQGGGPGGAAPTAAAS